MPRYIPIEIVTNILGNLNDESDPDPTGVETPGLVTLHNASITNRAWSDAAITHLRKRIHINGFCSLVLGCTFSGSEYSEQLDPTSFTKVLVSKTS
jgi:hypothetical protein